jgi:hypothetical protein
MAVDGLFNRVVLLADPLHRASVENLTPGKTNNPRFFRVNPSLSLALDCVSTEAARRSIR